MLKTGPVAVGLPGQVHACLFDLDGVLTETATLHAAAWKAAFDEHLRARSESTGERFVEFDAVADYERYVDGKPRDEGTRSFLASRGIRLSEKAVRALGKRKNELLLRLMRSKGVTAFPGSVRYVRAVRRAGLRTAVVSSSKNCRAVLNAAGIADLFDAEVDGVVAEHDGLKGKPAPDTYLAASRLVATAPEQAAVFEDALAGVESGRAGRFGFVVGIDRVGQADELRRHGADVVVDDLAALLGTS